MNTTIHIFNPDHDLALAANIANFTAPHAGRQLRTDLGYLPALWAEDGDYVLVDDKEAAVNAYRKLKLHYHPSVTFVCYNELKALCYGKSDIEIKPWGWNLSLVDKLQRAGVPQQFMPSRSQLSDIRELSNRRLAVKMLDSLSHHNGVTGFSHVCNTYEELISFLDNTGDIVAKAPWSSSGRGVRYVTRDTVDENTLLWISNTIIRQHSIIGEIRCQKVHDFAVEFMAEKNGNVRACGLSLFSTVRGAYTGNRLITEEEKLEWLFKYIDSELFYTIVSEIEAFLSEHIGGHYTGPLGVDMMIVGNGSHPDCDSFLLNPCIEINLRRTMGHVALALSNQGHKGSMHIDYNGHNYKMKISK